MRCLVLIIAVVVSLSGCQPPIVTTRSYLFSTKFVVNGKQYDLNTKYKCHYEDLTWISTRGKDWHIREGGSIVRIIGSFEDGARFEVLPRSKTWGYNFCSDKTEPVDARLFIETDSAQIESFDKFRNVSAIRNVEFIDTKLSHVGSWLATFVEHQDWPAKIKPTKRYYTVQLVVYDSAVWKNKPEIVALIESKKILWLENGKTYPFSAWSENDVTFARLRQYDRSIDGYTDPAPRLPLVPEGEKWVYSTASRHAIQWLLEPLSSNTSRERESIPSEKIKRWIVFKDSNIEIPLQSFYRTFYQPEHDRLLEFRVEHVDLW